MTISEVTGLIGVAFGAISLVGGFFLWYRGAVEKGYAAKRAFDHIQGDQKQMVENIKVIAVGIDDDMTSLNSALKELNYKVDTLSQRFEVILSRLESRSPILGNPHDRD